ncbi:MAG: NAD-dependent dehydratase, partial [Spirochaetales bacterium]|nr:NAD-dependent dehydratase [Spirochaetales bacterium]
ITRGKIAQMLLDAGTQGKLNVQLLRGSDFFGPRVSNSSLGDVLFKAALAGKTINVLGNPDLVHSTTYIVDFAWAMILAGENPQIKQSVFHVPNSENITMRKFVELVGREVGRPLKLRASGSSMVGFIGLFNPMIKEIKEMMYQWVEPFVVDHSLFSKTFDYSATGHNESIRDTVSWFREQSNRPAS